MIEFGDMTVEILSTGIATVFKSITIDATVLFSRNMLPSYLVGSMHRVLKDCGDQFRKVYVAIFRTECLNHFLIIPENVAFYSEGQNLFRHKKTPKESIFKGWYRGINTFLGNGCQQNILKVQGFQDFHSNFTMPFFQSIVMGKSLIRFLPIRPSKASGIGRSSSFSVGSSIMW